MRYARARLVVCSVLMLCAGSPLPVSAESYVFNSKRTEVRFTFMMGLATQRGRFSHVEGLLHYDERAPQNSEVVATIDTASVDTGQPLIDNELKGINFFNSKEQSAMTFRSRSVTAKDAGSAQITGDITVNGITKPVMLDVVLTPHDDPSLKYSAGSKRFVGKTSISRRAFKMDSYADMVGDEIGIEIDAIVRPKL